MKMKKAYFLVVLFLCGLSVENLFAAAPAAGRLGQQLIDAARAGNEPEVERLIAAGADVNAASADVDRNTALMLAASLGHENIVELLLQVDGIDVNAADRYGRTALILAAINGHENIVELLLQVDGIDVNAANLYGKTALMWAAIRGHENIVKMLLDAGADRTIQDYRGQTAEAEARENDHEDLANMIRDYVRSGRTVKRAITGPDKNYM